MRPATSNVPPSGKLAAAGEPPGAGRPTGGWPLATPLARTAAIGALLAVVAVVLTSELLGTRPAPALVAFDVVVGIVGSVALPMLTARQTETTLAVIALSALSPAATPLAATATLWTARRAPLRIAAPVAVAGVVALQLRGLWRPTAGLGYGWWLALVVAVYAALVGWGAWRQAHVALLASLEDRARRAEAQQASQVAAARLAERTRIAREMHDVLAHRLSLLSTYAGALEFRPDAPAAQRDEAVAVIRGCAHQALEELRDVIGVLREDPSADATAHRPAVSLGDLGALLDECRRSGMRIQLTDDLAPDEPVPDAVGRTVYRVVQEALTNARKHAPGTPVDVTLAGNPGRELNVVIRNPRSRPMPVDGEVPGGGVGLVGLAERVQLSGGRLDHGATADGGYQVRARLPWPP